ncbi:UxaA family hydrolase [Peptoniphilus sp. AGMB00490]|uniref:UxaA family hydrolase n=1 Tax=Peptoniphilus faecalis TaxID=2731255 RepID=A0A848RI00_9FIRM|nr:UxaA family hydrolase [Peptoniphilus faecalis]NMW85615.1 UxaA family hydrolase [Peptoniphilus faecalis]
MINAVIINEKDNVIVAIEPIKKGDIVEFKDLNGNIKSIKAIDDIKIYHKLALTDIKKGEPVIKYGEHIGFALNDIKIGEHVHDHNIEGRREDLEAIE